MYLFLHNSFIYAYAMSFWISTYLKPFTKSFHVNLHIAAAVKRYHHIEPNRKRSVFEQ